MTPKRRTILLGALVVTAACSIGYWIHRRNFERARIELGACLIGEPLAPGERASERMTRIDLARPPSRSGEKSWWPESCAPYAQAVHDTQTISLGSVDIRSYAGAEVYSLAHDLANPEVSNSARFREADEFSWLEERQPFAGATARRPWAPIVILPSPAEHSSLPCSAGVMETDDSRAITDMSPRCVIETNGTERLAKIRAATADDSFTSRAPLPRTEKVAGASLAVGCRTNGGGAFLHLRTEPFQPKHYALTVDFGDAEGNPLARATIDVTSRVDSGDQNRARTLDASRPILSCKAQEAHIAWAWATSIDGMPNEEIVVVTCAPGHCETKTAVVNIETTRHSNCGMCKPTDDELQVEPPHVVDLFDSTAIVWTDDHTVRSRIAPIDKLATTADQVLWYEAITVNNPFRQLAITPSRDIALVFAERLGGAHGEDAATRLFRLTAAGPRELTASP